MRFFIDEQSNPALEVLLNHIFRHHEFRTFQQEKLAGTEDRDLFTILAARGFDVIVTDDRGQLQSRGDRTERERLRAAPLHWVGYKRPNVGGPAGLAVAAGGLLSGFPAVLDALAAATVPTAITVRGSLRLPAQLIKVDAL
ncbi:MAG TPA: hypothetical protein VIU11_03945 [Nakamurella sp.]